MEIYNSLCKKSTGEIEFMQDKYSLLNLDGLSDVIIRLLDMLEKVGVWVVTPKGAYKDFEEAIEEYKKYIMNDDSLPILEKTRKYAQARKELKEYINKGKIISYAVNDIKKDAQTYNVDEEWLMYFFDSAKNISDDKMQRIWGKLLAERVNGKRGITKRLINIFSMIEQQDIELFCMLCAMSFKHFNDKEGVYPLIYIRNHPAYYNKYGIRRYNLAQLDNLGLIEYDTHGNFVLPAIVPTLLYDEYIIDLESNFRINTGNVRFTEVGKVLYNMTQIVIVEDFLTNCKEIWDKMGIKYEIRQK